MRRLNVSLQGQSLLQRLPNRVINYTPESVFSQSTHGPLKDRHTVSEMHYADFTEQEKSAKEIYYYYNITIILFHSNFRYPFLFQFVINTVHV